MPAVNAEKLVACRTPEVIRYKGDMCLIFNIFSTTAVGVLDDLEANIKR